MIRPILIIILMSKTFTCLYGQPFNYCKVYQFLYDDSINKKLVLIQTLDDRGRLIQETYSGFKASMSDGEGLYSSVYYFYQDTLLIEKLTALEHGDSIKWIYSYNEKYQLYKEEIFKFEKHYKEGRVLSGCLRTEEDREDEKRWKKFNQIDYSYDSAGNKIEHLEPKEYWGRETRIIYEYDKKQRVRKTHTYQNDKLFSIDIYHYTKKGFTQFYDEYNRGSKEGYTGTSHIIKVTNDAIGRLIEYKMIFPHFENSKIIYNYFYVGEKLVKKVRRSIDIDLKSQDSITHIYTYDE